MLFIELFLVLISWRTFVRDADVHYSTPITRPVQAEFEILSARDQLLQHPPSNFNITDISHLPPYILTKEFIISDDSTNAPENTQRERHLLCYYIHRNTLPPGRIPLDACTHITFAFAHLKNGKIALDTPEEAAGLRQLVYLKNKKPSLKVLVSIGGGGRAEGFPAVVRTAANRTQFINSTVVFLKQYNLDGLDLDWEFPTWGGPIEERSLFSLLLKELRGAYGNKYLLTAAVAAAGTMITRCYEPAELGKYLDYVNLMSYDYHSYSDSVFGRLVGHNSPLFAGKYDFSYFSTLNTAWSAKVWAYMGVPRQKLLVGLPSYGKTYTLAIPTWHEMYALATGPGKQGLFIDYPSVCGMLKNGSIRVFDKEQQVPYTYIGDQWVGYDDTESVVAKASWIVKERFGGAMTWVLNSDDAAGKCDGVTEFPLTRLMWKTLTLGY